MMICCVKSICRRSAALQSVGRLGPRTKASQNKSGTPAPNKAPQNKSTAEQKPRRTDQQMSSIFDLRSSVRRALGEPDFHVCAVGQMDALNKAHLAALPGHDDGRR